MSKYDRDIEILRHILKYCDEISETQIFFGNSLEVFNTNAIYRNAVAMCILQIGELSGSLSESFKEANSGVPWRNIKGMRNIMAHKYGEINATLLWETVIDDIPMLKMYCINLLDHYK